MCVTLGLFLKNLGMVEHVEYAHRTSTSRPEDRVIDHGLKPRCRESPRRL
jgi:hypothetical protein